MHATTLNGRVQPRFPTPAVAGHGQPDRLAPAPRKRRPAARKPVPATAPNPATARWAAFGVGLTLILSAGLNGYANAQHATVAWAGWAMGVAVPVLILSLSKVAGEKWLGGQRPVAWAAAGSGAALLGLSVWHCASSISLLTGSPVWLAFPMAIAVDAGLVSFEVALVTERR